MCNIHFVEDILYCEDAECREHFEEENVCEEILSRGNIWSVKLLHCRCTVAVTRKRFVLIVRIIFSGETISGRVFCGQWGIRGGRGCKCSIRIG